MKLYILIVISMMGGCAPISISLDANWGANQKFKKTIELDQKQTKAQTESQTTILEDIIKVIPFLTPQPTPTPVIEQKVKSITIELEPKSLPEIPVYTTQPYLAPARKPKPYLPPCKK